MYVHYVLCHCVLLSGGCGFHFIKWELVCVCTYIHTYVGESGQCRHMGINWKPAPDQGGVGSRPEEVWARAAKPCHQCRHVLQVGHRQRVAGDALPESSWQEQGGTHFYFKIYACNSEWVTDVVKWRPMYLLSPPCVNCKVDYLWRAPVKWSIKWYSLINSWRVVCQLATVICVT